MLHQGDRSVAPGYKLVQQPLALLFEDWGSGTVSFYRLYQNGELRKQSNLG